jgi:hypothetical protein
MRRLNKNVRNTAIQKVSIFVISGSNSFNVGIALPSFLIKK